LPAKIAASDDLHLAPLRDDGETYGTSTWILSALVDGALYVSAYNGKASRWNQAAKLRGTVQSCWARNRCERGACAAAGSAGNARIGPLASQTADYSIAEVADVRVGSSSSIMAPTRALLVNPNELTCSAEICCSCSGPISDMGICHSRACGLWSLVQP
jgi:hypothetical protein